MFFLKGIEANHVNVSHSSHLLYWDLISGQIQKQVSYPLCYKNMHKRNVPADVLPNEHSNKMA
jgi:hypothetical protein